MPRGAVSGEQQRERGAVDPTVVLSAFAEVHGVQSSGVCCGSAFDPGKAPPAHRASYVLRSARPCTVDVTGRPELAISLLLSPVSPCCALRVS